MPRAKTNEKYSYLLDYVKEAVDARSALKEVCERAIKAYHQQPSRNTYRENAQRYKQTLGASATAEKIEAVKMCCDSIPDATNDTVFNAVETFVSMAMGGAEQFEYLPADEYMEKDPGLIERLSALAKYFHDDNKIDSLIAQATRNMVLQGQACFYLNPIDGGRFKVSLIDAWKKLDDPRYLKTNRKRYEGFTEVTSWKVLRDSITKTKTGYVLKTINDVDQYVKELSGSFNHWEDEVRQDLDIFKGIYSSQVSRVSKAVDKNGKETNPVDVGYKGDDVEVSYIWDLENELYAVIVNRRFIVKVDEHPYKRSLSVPYIDSEGVEKNRSTSVELESPMVTIPFLQLSNETFPTSPLFYCLDDFDAICSMESVMNHNFSIMAPITFLGTSYDAEQISLASQVAGQIAEGTAATMQVLNKSHDMSSLLVAIQRREERIKRMLGATDQYEMSQMIGNRATASEISALSSAVSQRMNNPLANIETGMSELIQKMFAMYIIFADGDELSFPSNGALTTVTKVDMLGRSIIHAKLKSQIKIQQQEQSRNALMVLQTLVGLKDVGVNVEQLVTTLVPLVTQGTVNRRQAESFVSQPAIDPVALMEMVKAAQQPVQQPAMDEATMSAASQLPQEDLEGMMSGINGGGQPFQPANPLDSQYNMAQQVSTPTVDTGVDNYQAGLEQNSNPMQGII